MFVLEKMILDTSEINAANDQLINDVVGNSFSFFHTIRLGTTDSKLMGVDHVSSYLKSLMNDAITDVYVSVELRPGGILVRLHKKGKTFTWVITYHQLTVTMEDGVTIREGNHFLKFKNNESLKFNKSFFEKLLRLKLKNRKIKSLNQKNKPFYKT